MIYIWLLIDPIVSLLEDIIKPILIIGILIFIDITLNLGITDAIVEIAEGYARDYFANNWSNML